MPLVLFTIFGVYFGPLLLGSVIIGVGALMENERMRLYGEKLAKLWFAWDAILTVLAAIAWILLNLGAWAAG